MADVIISPAEFRFRIRYEVGDQWRSAFAMFNAYGPAWSYDITFALLKAIERKQVKTVLGVIRGHYHSKLKHLDPDVRAESLATCGMFRRIYEFLEL